MLCISVCGILWLMNLWSVIHTYFLLNTLSAEQGEVLRGSASLSKGPLQLARVPHIQNARAIFSDFKSINSTFVQQVYTAPRLPHLSPTSLPSDLTAFLEEACLPGSVSDLEIEVSLYHIILNFNL